MKPRCLDLFCGAGGAAMGLHRAGFTVFGVDIKPQPRYPFEFHQGDALTWPLEGFDLIWASPPCQGYSILGSLPWLKGKAYQRLIEPVRTKLEDSGAPWCIENVPGAPLRSPARLCGQMFGLPLYRHRLFESSFFALQPPHSAHRAVIGAGRMVNDRGSLNASSARGSWGKGGHVTVAGHQFKKSDGQRALGIDWMTRDEMAQAIPPAYSEHVGRYAMIALGLAAA